MKKIFLSYFIAILFLGAGIYISGNTKKEIQNNEINVLIKDTQNVVKMPVEQYITGVVCAEMPSDFEYEALKAQAVAARTYLYYKMEKENKHNNADICTDFACCCAYLSYEELLNIKGENWIKNDYKKIKECVSKTAGEIVTYEGKPILAVFHSATGGKKTEKSGDVWTTSLPYLTNVETFGESEKSNFSTSLTYDITDFKNKIKENCKNANFELPEFINFKYTDGGAVDTVEIYGVKLKGVEVRKIFGLKSACFDLEKKGQTIIFNVRGSGHGVGMSQYGANYMAKEGKNYKEILETYYKGTKITKQ